MIQKTKIIDKKLRTREKIQAPDFGKFRKKYVKGRGDTVPINSIR